MLAAGLVFVGTHHLTLSTEGFAAANVVVVAASLLVAWLLYREYQRVNQSGAAAGS